MGVHLWTTAGLGPLTARPEPLGQHCELAQSWVPRQRPRRAGGSSGELRNPRSLTGTNFRGQGFSPVVQCLPGKRAVLSFIPGTLHPPTKNPRKTHPSSSSGLARPCLHYRGCDHPSRLCGLLQFSPIGEIITNKLHLPFFHHNQGPQLGLSLEWWVRKERIMGPPGALTPPKPPGLFRPRPQKCSFNAA